MRNVIITDKQPHEIPNAEYICTFSLENNDIDDPDFIMDVKLSRVLFGKSTYCVGWEYGNFMDYADGCESIIEVFGKDSSDVGYMVITKEEDYFIIKKEE